MSAFGCSDMQLPGCIHRSPSCYMNIYQVEYVFNLMTVCVYMRYGVLCYVTYELPYVLLYSLILAEKSTFLY